MTTKIHYKLSSTGLGKVGCSRRAYWSMILGYRAKEMPARIVYGIAVHKFVDVAYKTAGELPKAVIAAKKAFLLPKADDRKSAHLSDERHMLTTCFNLWTGFIQDDSTCDVIEIDGKPATEISFSHRIYEDDFIIVDLEGTIDKLVKFKGGCYANGDWKTTSAWDERAYFTQYEMSRQLRLYQLACKLEAKKNPDSTLGKLGHSKMGSFIDAIFIKPDANSNVIKRSDVFQYSVEELEEFHNMLLYKCKELSLKHQSERHLDREGIVNGSCEGKWGKCEFWNVCQASNTVAGVLLKRDFEQREWNPLNYNGVEE